jgi:hypothetical protein
MLGYHWHSRASADSKDHLATNPLCDAGANVEKREDAPANGCHNATKEEQRVIVAELCHYITRLSDLTLND